MVYPSYYLNKTTGAEYIDAYQFEMMPGSGPYLLNNQRTMEAIIEKANKLLPFGLRAQKLVPFFIGVKLVSFAFFAIFMMNR